MARTNQRSAGNPSNLEQRRAERRRARGQTSTCDWASVEPDRIVAIICAIASQNGLCSFGYTRDGGAYTLTAILDGERYTDYCRPTEDVNAFLANLCEDYTDLA